MLLAALFEGGGSLLPAGLILCAISGWLYIQNIQKHNQTKHAPREVTGGPVQWLLFCSAQPTAFTARMPSDHMDTAPPSELACLPQEPRVTMRHKISSSYKTMFANCCIPNGYWKTLVPYCSKQNSLQA